MSDFSLSRVSRVIAALAVASLFLLISLPAWGQHSHRPQSTAPPPAAGTGEPTDPELEAMTRAAAIQARPDQVGYFHSALSATDATLRQSRELQALGPAAGNIATVNARSLKLRDAIDEVEHYDGIFMASFTKTQSAELKPLVKHLRKSYTFVAKQYKAVQKRMEPGKVVPERLTSAAMDLEKSLFDFRANQIRLAREMGIQAE